MLSNLLNPDRQVQHAQHSPASTPHSPSSEAASVNQSGASTPMATTAAMSMSNAMNADENRPDLPRPYKCPLCDKAFHRLEHQTRHIRTHTGEKPHACQFPGCTKRFSRSDELTRHSRIHSNPNSRRGNKSHASATAVAALQAGMFDNNALQYHLSQSNQHQIAQINHLNNALQPSPVGGMLPPPPKTTASAPGSQLTSPNVSPPHSFATYSSNPGSYLTRNVSGDISPAASYSSRGPMDINLLATAASQVERENNALQNPPSHHLSLPNRSPYHVHPYGNNNRMPSLSSYHYSSNPTSQPMSRSHSHEDDDPYSHRMTKKSRPGSPQSTAPPSPSFSHESTSPTPDHTPLATPSHSPRLRPQYFHNGVQLPTLHHLSLQHQPPPALAPVEPSADGQQPYVPTQHSGLRISEIMETGNGAQRKLPVPLVPPTKESHYTKINELVNPGSGLSSGQSSTRASEAGNDLQERN